MMDWGREIQNWAGWTTIRQWDGWRRFAPAAGSVAAHVVIGAAIVSVMAASVVKPRPVASPPPPPELQVTLVAETPRPQPRPAERPTPRPPKAQPDAAALPEPRPAPRKDERRKPEVAETPEEDSVFVPPSIFSENVPLGLRNMASEDRCNPRKGIKPADCGPQWSDKIGPAQSWQLASRDELKQFYGDIIGPCRFRVGCEPGEWISSIGTRSVAGTPMAGGAAGISTGAESQTGRLALHPDHVDPGFGD
jgi:hypothetical protein